MENLILNGNFENLYTGTSWTTLAATQLGGWQVRTGGRLEVGAETVYRGGQGDRNNAIVELDNNGGVDNLFQDIQTETGETYTLSFDSALRAGTSQGTNTIEVYWNGERVASVDSASTNWQTNSFRVEGTGGADRLEFREPAGDSNGVGGLLDNVSLVAQDANGVNGTNGNNILTGTGGNDEINGLGGNDTIMGSRGNDAIDGGTGTDTVSYAGNRRGYSVTDYNDDGSIVYRDNDASNGNDGTDVLSNVERVSHSGGGLFEVQSGGAGDDVITSQTASWDIMSGGAGNDTITGSWGGDSLGGASGNDVINGGGGNDMINGGSGDDVINGGSGTDTAIFANNVNAYTITQRANGSYRVVGEGTDIITGVELFQFGGQTLTAAQLPLSDGNLIQDGDFQGLMTARWGRSEDGYGAWEVGGIAGTVAGVPTNAVTPTMMEIGQETAYLGTTSTTNYVAEINGDRYSQDAIFQNVQTEEGQTYQLNFDAAGRQGFTEEDGRFNVFWNDELVGTIEPETNRFEHFTFHVEGTGGSDRLTFQEDLNEINARTTGGILDNVSLVAVDDAEQIVGTGRNDTIVGRDSAETINGGAGNDTIYAGGGNDTIIAGTGRNFIDGGTGNDTAVISGNRANYRVALDDDGGVLLYNTQVGMRVTEQELVNVENVRFNDGTVSMAELTSGNNRLTIADDRADLVIGSEGNDVVLGGVQGHNIIMGLGGNDLLVASGGKDDILIGGTGNDTLEGGRSEGVFFDGGRGNDTIRGSTGDDVVLFTGEGGNDTVVGNGGNDIIIVTDEFGSSVRAIGNLQMNLTRGTSTQAIEGNNYTVFNFSADAVGTLTYTDDSGDISTLNFRDVDQLNLGIDVRFGSGENTFSPVSGQGDILVSGPARFSDYTMYGGVGDDSFFGATPGRDLIMGGAGDDFASGFVGDDYIFGEAGNDELHGRSDNDYLDGGTGDDNLNGWQDEDTLIGGEGNDTLDGGEGIDTAIYSGNLDEYTVSQNANGTVTVASNGANTDGTDTLTTIEMLVFGENDPITVAQALGNGGGGTNDVINGTAGNDILDGGAGNDTINGLDGWDVITGGTGDDTLSGGDLGDIFLASANDGNDIITDFEAGLDLLDLSAVANNIADLGITQEEGNTVVSFDGGSMTLTGFDGNFLAGDIVIDGVEVI